MWPKWLICVRLDTYRDVAQLGSALRSGRRGRWFESSHPDYSCRLTNYLSPCRSKSESAVYAPMGWERGQTEVGRV